MGKYKYDIISSKESESKATLPQYFLGDTAVEAEATLKEFEGYLNNLASSYASATPSIERSDFFIEGVEALAKAKRDFNPKKGGEFAPYAKFLIVDAMNECIRENRAVVRLPSNISKANRVIYRIKGLLGARENEWFEILFKSKEEISEKLEHYKKVFMNAADRAGLTYRQLAERAEFLPATMSDEHIPEAEHYEDVNYDEMMAKLVVDKIIPMLTEDERKVAELIMHDLNNVEIAAIIGKSDVYVGKKIQAIKQKVFSMLSGE